MSRIDLRNCSVYLRDGLSGTAVANKKTNEKQTITVTDASGGTFTIAYGTDVSGPLAWNLTTAQLQAAVEALAAVGEGNVSVTGTAGVSYIVEFIGTMAQTNVTEMTIDDTLVTGGGSVNVTIATTTAGGAGTAPIATDTSLSVTTVVTNAHTALGVDAPTLVPVGASFTIAGEAAATKHVVTARTPADTAPTTSITFTPALGAPTTTYASGAVLTFSYQEIEVTIGEGDAKWTEANQYKYDLDRGQLDTVRTGDDVPMDVSINATFDQIISSTGDACTPYEAFKGVEAAAEWVSSSADECEPYAVDLVIIDTRPCGTVNTRTYLFPDFRSEKRDFDIKTAVIAVSGKCNAIEPIVTVG